MRKVPHTLTRWYVVLLGVTTITCSPTPVADAVVSTSGPSTAMASWATSSS